jgi:hypothetical protein
LCLKKLIISREVNFSKAISINCSRVYLISRTYLQHRFAQGGMLRAENHRTYKCNFCVNICVMLNDIGVAIKKQAQGYLGLLTLVLFSFLKIVLLFLSYHTDVTRSWWRSLRHGPYRG